MSACNISALCPIYYESISRYANKVALIDHSSSYTYEQLHSIARQLSHRLSSLCRQEKSTDDTIDANSVQIGVLCPNDASFVIALWASWMIGATVIPLSLQHPPTLIAYFLNDAQCRAIIVGDDHCNDLIKTTLENNSLTDIPIININKNDLASTITHDDNLLLPTIDRKNALILYTSGTSGKPKGCVITFNAVQAHVDSMVKAWDWITDDVILHVLPLHHIHGLINALLTPHFIGAKVIMIPRFDASKVWEYLIRPAPKQQVTVFTGVPTIYAKLIQEYDAKCLKIVQKGLCHSVT
ncbi:unnamed protein product [Rotaria sp. Silwood2]|nr:unnamed protein product [Rotaria sp. Silwood2]